MNTILKTSPFLLAVIMMLWSGCASTKKSKTAIPNYIGQWNYVLQLPDGDNEGYLRFTQENDQVLGVIGGDQGETQLSDFIVDDEKVSGNFEYMGYFVNMSGTFEGNVLNGKMATEGYEFPFEAQKQE
jgi:hypothetical protein